MQEQGNVQAVNMQKKLPAIGNERLSTNKKLKKSHLILKDDNKEIESDSMPQIEQKKSQFDPNRSVSEQLLTNDDISKEQHIPKIGSNYGPMQLSGMSQNKIGIQSPKLIGSGTNTIEKKPGFVYQPPMTSLNHSKVQSQNHHMTSPVPKQQSSHYFKEPQIQSSLELKRESAFNSNPQSNNDRHLNIQTYSDTQPAQHEEEKLA